MVYLTRRETFNAAHRLYNPKWSEEKNKAIFGKCSNPNYHGHNYELFVTIKGKVDADTGFVMNAHLLSKIVKEKIKDKVDHCNLNIDVHFMEGILPSTENFVIGIWNELEASIKPFQLHKIRLKETENIYVDYFGES
ncbi:UNVERIFIED_CONTAM: hypothetical protein GTU68_052795 [Idotea baltica]|nr:hypothetical protein [Idotea baltica]